MGSGLMTTGSRIRAQEGALQLVTLAIGVGKRAKVLETAIPTVVLDSPEVLGGRSILAGRT